MSTDYLLKDALEAPDAAQAMVPPAPEADPLHTVTLEEANDYLGLVERLRGRIAAGVGLCILCPVPLLRFAALADGTPRENFAAGAGIIILLVMVALGVLLILPAALQLDAYDYLEKEVFQLEHLGGGRCAVCRGVVGRACLGGPERSIKTKRDTMLPGTVFRFCYFFKKFSAGSGRPYR